MPEILLRFCRHLQQVEDERQIAKLILEGNEVEAGPGWHSAGRPTATTGSELEASRS